MDPALSPPDTNGSKRKSEDGSSQPRAKRNRYISIACNECKRRKIKCNGNTPCQRCGNLNLECVYAPNCCGSSFKDSDEFKQMNAQIAALQNQVDALFTNVTNLHAEFASRPHNPALDPSLEAASYDQHELVSQQRERSKSQNGPRAPTFRGPMSNSYSFDVAKSSLHTMGISPEPQIQDEDRPDTDDPTPMTSPRIPNTSGLPVPTFMSRPRGTQRPDKDPIWSVSETEALRLVKVYEDEMHEMYPLVSLPQLRMHIKSVYRVMGAFLKHSFVMLDMPGADAISDEDTNVLKLVLAVSLTAEGKGESEIGRRLFECVQPHVDALLLGDAGVKAIRILVLVAMVEFHRDNESTAWRIIGLSARLCIELGLHRSESYANMAEEEDRNSAMLLFWSVYTLDRRWSFGTGMPFALQDSDIDPQLPRPGDKSPYLTAMIDYCAIGSRVWQAIGTGSGATPHSRITRDDIGYLDYQVRQWYRSLPEQLHFDYSLLQGFQDMKSPLGSFRLRLILYLRQNSMLMNIYRPVLYSATSISRNKAQAHQVIDVAKDTIRLLTRINQISAIYQSSQVLFNAFLTSALAVLFLAVSHLPATYADHVREEVDLALDLVRGLSKGSLISKRLWKTIRVLKQVVPKVCSANGSGAKMTSAAPLQDEDALNQYSRNPASDSIHHQQQQPFPAVSDEDPSRSAALAMADLAGQNLDHFTGSYDTPATNNLLAPTPADWSNPLKGPAVTPDNMADDLTRLFEAAGAFENSYGASGYGGIPTPTGSGLGSNGEGVEGGFGGEDELSRIMRDLF